MLCQLRTIGAGIAVLALCLMLASLSWQFVLLGFALASIAWACWSCSVQISQCFGADRRTVTPRFNAGDAGIDMSPSMSGTIQLRPGRRRMTRDNLYSFPRTNINSQGGF